VKLRELKVELPQLRVLALEAHFEEGGSRLREALRSVVGAGGQ
jgi:hypothetical protein